MADQPRIELTRVIRASKAQVFEAWTSPALMARWMAPGAGTVVTCAVDLRVGGNYHLHMRGEMRGRAYDVIITGAYREILAPDRLCFSWTYDDEELRESVGNSIVTIALRQVREGTELTLVHEKIATKERRAGHLWGWNDCLEKLESTLVALT